MSFAFSGFFQDGPYRVLKFEGLPREAAHGAYWVRADMRLVLQHHIPVQDLPLLCRAMLERHLAGSPEASARTVTYSASDMKSHADLRDAEEQSRSRRSFARRPRAVPAHA